MARYELTYYALDNSAAEIVIDAFDCMDTGVFTRFITEDGTAILIMPNQRVLECLNLDLKHLLSPTEGGEEVGLGQSDGGRFMPPWIQAGDK